MPFFSIPYMLRRSTLIVPLSAESFISKAHLRGADVIMLDLEDGVAATAKSMARSRLGTAAHEVARGGARVLVRVNRPLNLLVEDLAAAVIPGVHGIVLAKVEGAGHIRLVSEAIGELEAQRGIPPGTIRLSATIETPQALQRVAAIARADPRLESIGMGSLDLAASCGFEPAAENLLYAMQSVLIAAKAAGIHASGYLGSIADFHDLEGMRALLDRSRRLGMTGGTAIHPNQVTVLNEVFSPRPESVSQARDLIAHAETAFSRGQGAFKYLGRMVDRPVVLAAQQTVALAQAIANHEARRQELLAATN